MKTPFSKVMIIDDNAVDIYIAAQMILNNQFAAKVIECSSASEALKFLQTYEDDLDQLPQVIFLDIYMPLMSGFDFMNSYAALSQDLKNYCRVYILSSSIDDLDIVRSQIDENICKFLVKPITKDFLDQITDGNY